MYELVLFMGSGHPHCSCYTYCIHCTLPPAEQEAESCVTITQNETFLTSRAAHTRRYTTQPTCRTEQNLARSRKSTVPEDGKSLNLLNPIRCLIGHWPLPAVKYHSAQKQRCRRVDKNLVNMRTRNPTNGSVVGFVPVTLCLIV